jgi:hypothetical protein
LGQGTRRDHPLPGARRRVARGPKSGELLTLLLTPGRFRPNKPSYSKAFQANDRKSSKQPVDGSNPSGGVNKINLKWGKQRADFVHCPPSSNEL